MNRKHCLASRGIENTFTSRIGEIKTTWLTYTNVVILKAWHDPFDLYSNTIVIASQCFPIDAAAIAAGTVSAAVERASAAMVRCMCWAS